MERPQWRDEELVVMREKDNEEYEIDQEGTPFFTQSYRDTQDISAFGFPKRKCYWKLQGKDCRRNCPNSGKRAYVLMKAQYTGKKQLGNYSMSTPWTKSIGRSCLKSAVNS